MKSSYVYIHSLNIAQSNKTLIQHIGEPIKPGFFVGGRIGDSSSSIQIPISGSKASANILGIAKKSSGEWKFWVLNVTLENGKIISLLPAEK